MNLLGESYGRLSVLAFAGEYRTPKGYCEPTFECMCSCGQTVIVRQANLRSGNTKSCGCLARETLDQNRRPFKPKHGRFGTRVYGSWSAMIQRCTNQKATGYQNYGGRGVRVCERWRTSFENFLADMGERQPGTTLDRYPNKDGDYEPGNARWATATQQINNRRVTKIVNAFGETKPLAEWCRAKGFKRRLVEQRLGSGWSAERALTEPCAARTAR